MPKCEFNDMEPIFAAGKIWAAGYESYWFRKAWSELEAQNLTSYETRAERFVVLTRNANESMAEIHNRMLVIAAENEVRPYLSSYADALDIIHGTAPDLIRQPA